MNNGKPDRSEAVGTVTAAVRAIVALAVVFVGLRSRTAHGSLATAASEQLEVARLEPEVAVTLLQTVEERRQSLDQMMWQVPVLSLTAQSFLLTIGLGPDTSWSGRIVAAVLGVVASVATIQLLLKHRYHELLTARWLERFAAVRRWPNVHDKDRAQAFAYAGEPPDWYRDVEGWAPLHRLRRSMIRRRSPNVWIAALALFGLGHVLVLVAGVAWVGWTVDLLG